LIKIASQIIYRKPECLEYTVETMKTKLLCIFENECLRYIKIDA